MLDGCGGGRATARWRGHGGLEAFVAAGARLKVPHPARFDVRRRVVESQGLSIERWGLSAMTGEHAAGPAGTSLRLDMVRAGSVSYRLQGRLVEGGRGSAHLLPNAVSVPFTVPVSCELVRISLPSGVTPTALHDSVTGSFGLLPPSRLLDALLALGEQLLDPTFESQTTATADIVLMLARTELLSLSSSETMSLRRQMQLYIDSRLPDPSLRPATVAAAFGISLRWAHRVFNTGGTTIASYTRDQRCDAVATLLREDPRAHRVTALATSHGFGGRDQLTRAFRSRYDMTVGEYSSRFALTGVPPRPVSDQTPAG